MNQLGLWLKTLDNLEFKKEFSSQNFYIFSGIISYSPVASRYYKISFEVSESEILKMKIEFQKGRSFMNHINFDTWQSTTPERFIKRHYHHFRNSKIESII
jgi:hypothetical protein